MEPLPLDEVMAGSGHPVARIELWHFSAPLPATFRPAWIPGLPQTHNRATLIRVITADGVEGWSAGPAISRERAGLGDLIGPYLIGADATDIHMVQQRLREMSYLGWRNWWIEPAFWDIKGKLAGLPVWRLLGGDAPASVEVYASSGQVRSAEDRIREAEARYAEGFRLIKIRVHEDEDRDRAQLERTATAAGDHMRIAVDANQGWRVTAIADAPLWDLDRARRFAALCGELGVAWLEEPLAMDDYDGLAALTADSPVPIAGGELCSGGEAELGVLIDRRCYHIVQPDAVFTGGIAQTMRIIQRARAAGLRYTPHTWTNGLGLAINLQVFAASGSAADEPLEYPYDPPAWVPAARDAMLTQPLLHVNGRLRIPTHPGLGVEIDPRALRRWGHRFSVMDRKRLVWFALRDRGLRASLEIERTRRAQQRTAQPRAGQPR